MNSILEYSKQVDISRLLLLFIVNKQNHNTGSTVHQIKKAILKLIDKSMHIKKGFCYNLGYQQTVTGVLEDYVESNFMSVNRNPKIHKNLIQDSYSLTELGKMELNYFKPVIEKYFKTKLERLLK